MGRSLRGFFHDNSGNNDRVVPAIIKAVSGAGHKILRKQIQFIMSNKLKAMVAGGLAVVGSLVGVAMASAQALTTSTLATSIDTVNSTWYDYFTVFITNAWPFIVGAVVLVGLVYFGIRLIHHLFGSR